MTTATTESEHGADNVGGGGGVVMVLAWAAVGLPLLWGVAQTFKKALVLFS